MSKHVSQVPFQANNALGGHIVLLPGAHWVRCASKLATLGPSLLLCVDRERGGMFLPGACCTAMPPPVALLHPVTLALPLMHPTSHFHPLPHVGSLDDS